MKTLRFSTLALLLSLFLLPAAASADWNDCDGFEHDPDWGRKGRYCELRELELAALPSLTVDAGRNGGVKVRAWDEPAIRVVARVTAKVST